MQRKRCNLCFAGIIDYASEVKNKQKVISEFWNSLKTGIQLQPLITSPNGRDYRTVSKRKAFITNRVFQLGLIGVDDDSLKNYPLPVEHCAIEPQLHAEVYNAVQEYLRKKDSKSLAEQFNYVIVKGNNDEASVIFNVTSFSSENRKAINHLSKSITARVKNVQGVFVFVDEERSRYYLSDRPKRDDIKRGNSITKIYGRDKLFHKVGDLKFLYSVPSFSQTNHFILDLFLSTAEEFLELSADDTLYDLYCGYGLFSISLAKKAGRVIGMEVSRDSIKDAIENAKRNSVANAHFISTNINLENLQKSLKPKSNNIKLLLDPPRSGTASGVIECLAAYNPEKVLHIFCNMDIVERELSRWKNCGYTVVKAQPFDMFPGTSEIELMVALTRNGKI